jgi:dolichyl-phosphate beta-glucosyltransferase
MTSPSVIVPAYNEELRLAPTLRSLLAFAEDRTDDTEIIVDDDGSADKTQDVAREVGSSAVRVI